MDLNVPHIPGLDEEALGRQAPIVRAMVVQRLEQVWRTCAPHVMGEVDRPDPRLLEIGVRVLDRLMRLYRLDNPVTAVPDRSVGPVDAAGLVSAGLRELEAKIHRG